MEGQAMTMAGPKVATVGGGTGTRARAGLMAERSLSPQDIGGFQRLLLREVDGEGCAAPARSQGGDTSSGASSATSKTSATATAAIADPTIMSMVPVMNMAPASSGIAASILLALTGAGQATSQPETMQGLGSGRDAIFDGTIVGGTLAVVAGAPAPEEGGWITGFHAGGMASAPHAAAQAQATEVKPHDATIKGPAIEGPAVESATERVMESTGNAPTVAGTSAAAAGEAASGISVLLEPEGDPGATIAAMRIAATRAGESPHVAGGRLAQSAMQEEQGRPASAERAGGYAGIHDSGAHDDATGTEVLGRGMGMPAGAMNGGGGQEPGNVDPELVQVIRDVMARSAGVIRGQSEAADAVHTRDGQAVIQAPAHTSTPGAAGISRAGVMEAGLGWGQVEPPASEAQPPVVVHTQSPVAKAKTHGVQGADYAGRFAARVAGNPDRAIAADTGWDASHGNVGHGAGAINPKEDPEAYSVQSGHLQGGWKPGEAVETAMGAGAGAVTGAGSGHRAERAAMETGETGGAPGGPVPVQAGGVDSGMDAGSYQSAYGGESADRRAGQGMDQGSQQQGWSQSSQHQQAIGAVQQADRHAGGVPVFGQQPYTGDGTVPGPPQALVDEVVAQVVEKAALRFKEGRTEMTVQLKPDYLGRIHISVTDHAGTLTAGIRTESESVRALIEAGLPQLKTSLASQGFNIEQFTVSTGPGYGAPQFGFERGGGWQGMGPREGGRAAGAVKKLDDRVVGAAWAPSSRGSAGLIDYAV